MFSYSDVGNGNWRKPGDMWAWVALVGIRPLVLGWGMILDCELTSSQLPDTTRCVLA